MTLTFAHKPCLLLSSHIVPKTLSAVFIQQVEVLGFLLFTLDSLHWST